MKPADDAVATAQAVARMQTLLESQRRAFAATPYPALAARRRDLLVLRGTLMDSCEALVDAVSADFSARSRHETLMAEVMTGVHNIDYTLKRLRRWMRASRRHVPLHFLPARAKVVYQPLGVVGIIVPFNYPVNLAVIPLVAALAAGNRVMLKLSEHTPRTAEVLRGILGKIFSEEQVAVVTGASEVAAAFARLPFDHLFFTGSTQIGRLVMHEAAENLTPITLELGGKSPAIIADDIPLEDIIDRLCFAKSLNAGQTCVAPDYVLLPRAKVQEFIRLYRAAFEKMYPALDGNPDYTSMIHAPAREKMLEWLTDARTKGAEVIQLGPEAGKDGSHRLPQYLVTGATEEMAIMQHELFGPLLPLLPYDTLQAALDYVRAHPRPLALYLFTYDRQLQQQVTLGTQAGTMCINEALIHLGMDDLPLGGVGLSGMGQYRGREGFYTFSKAKAVLSKGRLNSMRLMYPPYGGRLQQWLMRWLLR